MAGSVLKWVIGALAVTGTCHAVSAASAVLASPSTIQGTVGTRLSYQIKVSDGRNRLPASWVIDGRSFGNSGLTTQGLPPGLSLSLNTAIISGTPTQDGTFPVTMTAYESPNRHGGSITFTLTFNFAPDVSPPEITAQPIGGQAVEGSAYTMMVAASGSSALTYQWSHGGNAIRGATNATLTLNPVKLADAGDYDVVVSDSAGSATSAAAILTVTPAVIPPSITAQPAGLAVHLGEKVTLAVSAGGSGPLSYLWRHGGTDVPGGVDASLVLASASPSDSGDYTVVISGPGGSVASAAANVAVVPLSLQVSVLNESGAALVFRTIPGRRYLIEAADTLEAGVWVIVRDLTASDNVTSLNDPAPRKAQHFWRYRPAP